MHLNKSIMTYIKYIKLTSLVFIAALFASCGNNKPSRDNQQAAQPAGTKDTSVAASAQTKTILFFGNSLTAGYGLEDPSTEAFPAVIQHIIDSVKLPYKIVNAGNSGETSAGGKARIGWILKQKVDVFVLELGANDGLRGISPKETIANLQAIVDTVKLKYPAAKLVLVGMQVPPNMGAAYANQFKTVFPTLAQKNNMALVPFLLEGVGGVANLNQPDGIHPTAEGAKIAAGNVWEVLKGVVEQ